MIIKTALKCSQEFKKSCKKALKEINCGPKDKKPLQEGKNHKTAKWSRMKENESGELTAEHTLKSRTKQNLDYVF